MIDTKKVKITRDKPEEYYLRRAADILREGGLVIIPTETVYGIAADRNNKKAMQRLFEAKKRPSEKHFSLHIEDKKRVDDFCVDIPIAAYKLMDKFWPGPLTLVLKDKGSGTIGLRMPDDLAALRVIDLSGVEVVCPSANISGEPAPVKFYQAIKDFEGLVDYAIDAGPTKLGIESSVVDLSVEPFRILREGAVKKEDIFSVAAKKTVLFVCTGNSCRSVMAEALLRKELNLRGRSDVEALSAGTMMFGGIGPTQETKVLLAEEGMDVSAHLSQKVNPGMLDKSDLILVMERVHEERIRQLDPHAGNRLYLLKEFARVCDNELDIPDPIGRNLEFYRQTLNTIREAVKKVADII